MAIGRFYCIKAGIAYTPGGHQRLFEPDGGKTIVELEEKDAPPHLFRRVESTEATAPEVTISEEPKKKAKK